MRKTTCRCSTLGRDLLVIHPVRRAVSLAMPFVLAIAFFVFSAYGRWAEAIASTMLLTFLTYGSISHDLVHRRLRLPPAVNEGFLSAIELVLAERSRLSAGPSSPSCAVSGTDFLEGAAAAMTRWRALLDGLTLQPRLWVVATMTEAHAEGFVRSAAQARSDR